MRHIALVLGTLLLAAGCTTFPHLRKNQGQPAATPASTEVPTKEAILGYLNDNAARVQSLRCKELDMDARQGLQSVGLRGQVVCQKPRNFRMSASVLGKQEVDLGSNDQEFWFWVARAEPPHLYHCSYDDMARGQFRNPFPFQPEWIMEALGLAEYGAPENYELKVQAHTLELVQRTRSPQGVALTKVTVISRGKAVPPTPQVMGHFLFDANGKELMSAHITRVQIDKNTGAIVPREVKLTSPADKTELKLKFEDVTINDPALAHLSQRLFTRPNLTNVTSFDLARGATASPTGIRRTSGTR